jgi:CubicO group peptidase (beta-lactamase class C family)
MRLTILAALLAWFPAGAADLTGRWTGTLDITGPDGTSRSQPACLVLKQDGSTLSGRFGPNPADMRDISKGAIADGQVGFDLPLGNRTMHAKLAMETDRLMGEIAGPGAPQLKLTLTRLVYPTAGRLEHQLSEIDALIAAAFSKRPAGSVTAAVVSGPQIVWSKSYGNADDEKRSPATKDTVYRIGSITKMFTALMLAQLVDDGKVHLSDPVEKYLPEVKTVQGRFPDAPPITLVQLSTHTAGLSREPDDLPTYLKGPVSQWEKVLIAALPHTHYQFEPGTTESYSNIGYAILGVALSRGAGQPYVEFVRKRTFEPLGMTHSAFESNPDMLTNLSKGYAARGKDVDSETPQREHEGRGYKVPNGAIYTTAGDLARFASFLLGVGPETVLKSDVLERNLRHQPIQANFDLSSGYGRAFEVSRRDRYTSFGHSGAVAGYEAALYMNREAGLAVIVLANSTGVLDTTTLALRSLDIVSK